MPPIHATPVDVLRQLAGPQLHAEPDEELLRRFCADRDKTAFAVIVRRHGGLVLDVCRAVLRNEADAEDAFQATFVALAADARRVRRPAALAGWLHAVAYRTAGKARRARERRRSHEARVPPRPDSPPPDSTWAEVREAIHEEVNRLPDRYRSAVVLFYLAGRTQDEVARALGLSTPGAKKRLERGRAQLRSALDHRGFGPTAALAATAIALPAPDAALAADAAEWAVRFLADRGAVPATILSLVSIGVRPMFAKIAFGAAVVVGVATTVGLGVLRGGPGDQPAQPDEPPAAKAKRPVAQKEPSPVSRAATELERFRALGAEERLKLVEKLGGDKPFSTVSRADLAAAVVERGSIEPASSFDVICKVKARDKESTATTIKWVIEDGSLVKKGDRLVELDSSALRDQLEMATVKVKEAEAALDQAQESVRLAQKEGAVAVRLAEIDAMVAEIELKDAEKSKPVLELRIEQAKLKVERARSRMKAHVARAEAEQRARAAAREFEARGLTKIEAELKQCVLTAPVDGLVMHPAAPIGRFAGPGAVVAAGESAREGQKLLRVAELKEMVMAVKVHEAQISTVRGDQTAEVRVDAYPGKVFRGKVTQVSSVASQVDWSARDVKVYAVTVAIADAPPGLKPFMTGEAHIATAERKAVLQVPLKAVVFAGRDRLCYVKSGQELIERKVVTGASNANSVEIKEGLKEEDLVVTDLPGLLVRP